jgi:hypothetical protein
MERRATKVGASVAAPQGFAAHGWASPCGDAGVSASVDTRCAAPVSEDVNCSLRTVCC